MAFDLLLMDEFKSYFFVSICFFSSFKSDKLVAYADGVWIKEIEQMLLQVFSMFFSPYFSPIELPFDYSFSSSQISVVTKFLKTYALT